MVAASCHYHLRRLRQIRRCVDKEVTIRLVLTLVISRLDYLQLTSNRSATVHAVAGTSSTRPERRSTSGVRAWRKRSRHRQRSEMTSYDQLSCL